MKQQKLVLVVKLCDAHFLTTDYLMYGLLFNSKYIAYIEHLDFEQIFLCQSEKLGSFSPLSASQLVVSYITKKRGHMSLGP